MPAQLLEQRIGETLTDEGFPAVLSLETYLHELLRTLDRQHAQHHGVDHAENRGVHADAERKRERRDSGKARTAAQLAKAVADILQKVFQVVYSAHITALLFDLFDATKLAQGCISGFLRRHPFCNVLLGELSQVKAKFLGQFLLNAALEE